MSDQEEDQLEAETDPFENMRDAKQWLDKISTATKAYESWQSKCDSIDKLYADLKGLADTTVDRQMQMFWANMEVLKPSVYSRPPQPVVASRFKDRKEVVSHGAEILERCLMATFEMEDIHETLKLARDDVAISGRGSVWLRYEADDYGTQKVCIEHVDRKDFLHEPARKWKEVGWVARRTYLTKEEMEERFGEDNEAVKAAQTKKRDLGTDDQEAGESLAEVWEIWSKADQAVVWVTPDTKTVLDIQEPFLDLEGFFPCPRPAYATLQRSTLIPVPDYVYCKDQLEEINELTARISALSEALKVKGFYSKGQEDVADAIERVLEDNSNNSVLVGVPNVAALGGQSMDKSIIWLPVDMVAQVIVQLVQLRKQLIDDVYQITGISDIMRGSTNANETLGAQQLKSQYGSVRVRDKQEEMVRLARDVSRIAAEIMAENFEPETLRRLSQYDAIPTQEEVQQQIMGLQGKLMQAQQNPQIMAMAQQNPEQAKQIVDGVQKQMADLRKSVTFDAVAQFLRSERTRAFALDIETDSTIQPDENAQKQRVTEFMGALSQTLAQLAPMISSEPKTAEFAGEVLKFALSPFRAGRTMEAAIDNLIEQMGQKAQQPQQNPEAQKAQMEAKSKQAELQLKQAELQIKAQEMQMRLQMDGASTSADIEKTKAEVAKIMAQIAEIQMTPQIEGFRGLMQ